MAEPLDGPLWSRRPCGTIGPEGLATTAAVDGTLVYAPLYDLHHYPPGLAAELHDWVFTTHADRRSLVDAAGVAGQHPGLDRGFRSARDGEVFGVTAHALSGDLAAVMAAIPRYEDPVTAFVVHWWMISSPEDDAQLVNLAVWQMLLHECAKRGYLAVTTQYDEATLKDRFTSRFALFKTARACLQEHGLEHLIS